MTDPRGKSVTIFGAGGAARAIAVELSLAGVGAITIVNRDPRRGEELAALVSERTPVPARFAPWKGMYRIGGDVDIVVNATSIGLYPDVEATLDLDLASLRPGMVVADVIPNPPRTRLIRDAEARGCIALDGLGMLVNQGVLNIKYWTGVDADAAVMRKSMTDLFGSDPSRPQRVKASGTVKGQFDRPAPSGIGGKGRGAAHGLDGGAVEHGRAGAAHHAHAADAATRGDGEAHLHLALEVAAARFRGGSAGRDAASIRSCRDSW